jgi:DNA-directed RNA polymerase subunit RPC12/RpoP
MVSIKEETRNRGYTCINCKKWVQVSEYNKTVDRNHCPYCLWSKHVDNKTAGDRLSSCNSGMRPIGLTIKTPRVDKWGVEVKGELMIIHECNSCGKISINRILDKDDENVLKELFEKSVNMSGVEKDKLKVMEIKVLEEKDREEFSKQLFGNPIKS